MEPAQQPQAQPAGDGKDPHKEAKNQLKKLMDSHMLILEHRLGRPATMDELMAFINEGSEAKAEGAQGAGQAVTTPVTQTPAQLPGNQPGQPAAQLENQEQQPKILSTKIFYGMAGEGETRQPDPNKILFYRSPDNRWYDTASQEWYDKEPSYASHLPCRDINFNEKDIIAAIAHGVLDDTDFEALDKSGMITDMPRQLWSKMKKLQMLHQQHETMTKSEDVEKKEESKDDEKEKVEEVVDNVGKILKEAGAEKSAEGASEAGEDLISQIMEAALAAVDAGMETKMSDIVKRLLRDYKLIADQDDHPPNGSEPNL